MLLHVREALATPPTQIPLEGHRQASVALVLNARAEVLFIRRADKAGDPWSGHVGLPGGHVEAGETFEQAARRETLEEVGLTLHAHEQIGSLDDRQTPGHAPSKLVRPFVFQTTAFGPLTLQAAEVASTHVLSIESLLAGNGRSSFPYTFGGADWTLPCVEFDGVRLWGLTLGIIDNLLHRIDGQGTGLQRPTGSA